MKLTRRKKIALAVATALPPIYFVLFVSFFLVTFLSFARTASGVAPRNEFSTAFLVIFPLHVLTMLLGLALLVVYVVHALQNEKLDQNTRHLWAVLIFVGSFISMSIYFFTHVLPLQDDAD